MSLHFAHPEVLMLLVVLPAIVFLMRRGLRLRRLTLQRFGAERLTHMNVWGRGAALLAIVCMVVASAEPDTHAAGASARASGGETVFLLDVSRSMLTGDAEPSRLERAKQVIADFVDRRPGDRFALVAFAGTQAIDCTLTKDGAFLKAMLKGSGPQSVSRGGTRIGDAIVFAMQHAFDDLTDEPKQLVLVTDGGDMEGGSGGAAAELPDHGIQLVVGGVGSALEDSPVPVSASDRTPIVFDGHVVKTHLDSSAMHRLAEAGHGEFLNVTDSYLSGIGVSENSSLRGGPSRGRMIGIALTAIAFVLLIAEALSPKLVRRQTIAIGLMAALALDSPTRLGAQETVYDWTRMGRDAYYDGKYFAAAEFFKSAVKLSHARLDLVYDLACAHYRDGRYDEAIIEFDKVHAEAKEGSDFDIGSRKGSADALYQKSIDAEPGVAESMLQTVLREYKEILKIRPGVEDVEFNIGIVEKRLAALQKAGPQSLKDRSPSSSSATSGTQGPGVATPVGGRGMMEPDW